MNSKTLCILANSVKNQQSCVAGVEVSRIAEDRWQHTQRWIRPISHRANGAISYQESYLHSKGRGPDLFDIVEIPLQRPAVVEGQPEDWLIEPSSPWKHHGQLNPSDSVGALLEEPQDLWMQQTERNDRVTPEWIAEHDLPSLYLVRPDQLRIYIQERDFGDGLKRSRRASFSYRDKQYDFGMTDPAASSKHFPDYQTRQGGLSAGIDLNCMAICVSLAPKWKGTHAQQEYHFKLVASVVEIT